MSNVVAFVLTPEARAASINKHFDEEHKLGGRCEYHRLQAGRELLAAEADPSIGAHGKWIAWCKANIKRGMRDIQSVMKMARAPEPEKAAAVEREKVAEKVRKHRNASYVTRISEDEEDLVERTLATIRHEMSSEQRGRFIAAFIKEWV